MTDPVYQRPKMYRSPLGRRSPAMVERLRPYGVPLVVPPKLLTVPEVALRCRVSKPTVYRMTHSGEIKSVRIGRSVRIPETEVDKLLAAVNGDPT